MVSPDSGDSSISVVAVDDWVVPSPAERAEEPPTSESDDHILTAPAETLLLPNSGDDPSSVSRAPHSEGSGVLPSDDEEPVTAELTRRQGPAFEPLTANAVAQGVERERDADECPASAGPLAEEGVDGDGESQSSASDSDSDSEADGSARFGPALFFCPASTRPPILESAAGFLALPSVAFRGAVRPRAPQTLALGEAPATILAPAPLPWAPIPWRSPAEGPAIPDLGECASAAKAQLRIVDIIKSIDDGAYEGLYREPPIEALATLALPLCREMWHPAMRRRALPPFLFEIMEMPDSW